MRSISRDAGEHDAGHADLTMKRSDRLLLRPGKVSPYLRIRMGRKGVRMLGKSAGQRGISLQSSASPEDSSWNMARERLALEHGQRKRKRMDGQKPSSSSPQRQMSCPKKGSAEKGQDAPPPGPARTGPLARQQQPIRLGARDDVRVSATDRNSQKNNGLAFKPFTRP